MIKQKNIFKIFIQFLIYIPIFVFLIPVKPSFPWIGLDPSWVMALDYAYLNNFLFGIDIIFTYGLYKVFAFPYYTFHPETYIQALSISTAVSILIIFSLYNILKKESFYTKILILIAIITAFYLGEMFWWNILPLLLFSVFITNNRRHIVANEVHLIFLIFACSFSILVKFSHAPVILVTVIIMDILSIFYFNKKPIYTISLINSFLILFYIGQGTISHIIEYISGSLSTLSGFSDAMQVHGYYNILYRYSIFALIFMIIEILLLLTFKINILLKNILLIFPFFLVTFMAFKNSFVRFDGHAIQGFPGLIFALSLLIPLKKKGKKLMLYYNILIIFLILMSISVYSIYHSMPKTGVISNKSNVIIYKILNFHEIFTKDYIITNSQMYDNQLNMINTTLNIPEDLSKWDVFPWDQSYIITRGLKYHPRPLFQSYCVYNSYLAHLNYKFYKSKNRPDKILFSVQEIDNRAPYMMEGFLWPLLLSKYKAKPFEKEFIILEKKESNLDKRILEEIEIKNTHFNYENILPNQSNIFIKIDIKKTLLGKLISILYKAPLSFITINLEDGKVIQSRYIPTIGKEGFFISPNIMNTHDYYRFSQNLDLPKVESFSISTEYDFFYNKQFSYSIYTFK